MIAIITRQRTFTKHKEMFIEELKKTLDLCVGQLLERLEFQSRKLVKNFPFLHGEGLWLGSDKLRPNDNIKEVLKHGTLSVGFCGLAEALVALTGKHHGESEEAQAFGLLIIKEMRAYLDQKAQELKLNFSLLATPAESTAGRFAAINRKTFGLIEGVTDKDYITNSFHVPVSYKITAAKKIQIEAPYHALTNAGHITYVEFDGDPTKNLKAFEKVICFMHDNDIGYGAINHPIDHDSVCGYTGIIDDTCPNCGRADPESLLPALASPKEVRDEVNDIPIERIRRVTGYLSDATRANKGKSAEIKERIAHINTSGTSTE
jgi:ribonucleoside-triphosphate reductase